ncbi:MAG: cupin domain-containing protein [Alphaproteobacteria bacterium]
MHATIAAFLTVALLAFAAAPARADMPYRGDGHVMVTPDELDWTDIASMAAPAKMAVIEGDLGRAEPFTFRLRLPDGYRILPHVHPAYERVTVLEGTLHFAHGEVFDADATTRLREGGVAIMAPGEPMCGRAERDVVIQLHGTGPWGITYIDPADDPRSDA